MDIQSVTNGGTDHILLAANKGGTVPNRPKPPRPTSRPRSMTLPARKRKPPKIPIKTYRWEEVKRAKARGGYPWNYLTLWRNMRDHEYEPVMPPPTVTVTSPTYDRYEPELGQAPKREGSTSSTESRALKDRKYLHIPLDDEMQDLPNDGEGSEDEVLDVEEKEEAYNRKAPSPGTTTGSRTDLEINTSQVDSSALEDLPLSREARRQQRLEQAESRSPGAAAKSLQRIRSQAGKLRTKLRNIKRPNIQMPERPRFSMPERPRFSLPDRPKFNLPERPKFSLPERPKFNIERPKFNLPSRPKFNLPERPKFNFPDRPKFNLPERPKINLPSFSLPRVRKPLRERQQQQQQDEEAQSTSLDVPIQEQNVHQDTPAPSTPGKRNLFDFRTYPRIFDRYKTSRQKDVPQRSARHITPPAAIRYEDGDDEMDAEFEDDDRDSDKPSLPPRRRSSGGQTNARWIGKFTELDYADSENVAALMAARSNGQNAPFDDDDDDEIKALERELQAGDTEEEHSESLSCFKDKDFGYAVTLMQARLPPEPPTMDVDDEEISLQDSEREVAHSSGSSSDRRRAGVLEEIDSDEFFLRQKGLSQEDIDVGLYLSNEIRDAFRGPPHSDNSSAILMENATLNEAELARTYRGTPERVISNKARPPRRQKKSKSRTPSTPPMEMAPEQYFNTFPPNKPTRNRRRQMRQQEKQKDKEKASTLGRPSYPTAPRRNKKRTRSEFAIGDNASQWSEDMSTDWMKTVESQNITNEVGKGVMVAVMRCDPIEHEYIIPPAPTAPKRGRKQGRKQTPSPNPAIQEMECIERSHQPDIEALNAQNELTDSQRNILLRSSQIDDDIEEPGYACVVKPGVIEIQVANKEPQQIILETCTPPPRKSKTLHRPPFPSIRRRRNRPLSGSFTVPHRRGPPTRPSRNYSTLGPSRPPRRCRRRSMEDLSNRDLQSGEVIKKMKERPLPPPPRPPRRERDFADDVITQDTALVTESNETNIEEDEENPDDIVLHTIKLSPSSEMVHQMLKIPSPVTTPEPPVITETILKESIEAELKSTPEIKEAIIPVETRTETCDPIIETSEPIIRDIPCHMEPERLEIQPERLEIQRESLEISAPQSLEIEPEILVSQVAVDNSSQRTEENIVADITESAVIPESHKLETISQIVAEVSQIEPIESQIEDNILLQDDNFEAEEKSNVMTDSAIAEVNAYDDFMPVEEVSVSTQTDPIPEEELIKLEMEQEEQIERHQASVQTITPPAEPTQQTPQVDIPSTAAAIIEALNNGQLRLQLLDVGQINVSQLQAQRLQVSDIEGLTLNVNELQSSGGSLVLNSLDAPLNSITEAILAAAQQIIPPPPPPPVIQETRQVASSSTGTQCDVAVEPIIRIIESPSEGDTPAQQYSVEEQQHSSRVDSPVISGDAVFSTPRTSPSPTQFSPVFTTEQVLALQAAAFSRPAQDTSSLAHSSDWQPPRQYQQQEIEPGIAELGSRLARACCTATLGALRRVVSYTQIRSDIVEGETGERGNLQVALCIVLVLVAGLILIGVGGSGHEVHHHHWDFYMPK